LPLRLPHDLLGPHRAAPNGVASHRPRVAQVRALLLLGRLQSQARLGGPHHAAAATALLRHDRGQRRGGRRPQPAGDLEREHVAREPGRRAGSAARPGTVERTRRMTQAPHLPVMPAEILEALDVRPASWVVDGTFGAGGHSRLLLEAGANVLAIDQDPGAERYARKLAAESLAGELRFAAGNFREMESLAAAAGVGSARGVFLDLGVSSMQLDEGERGFAFRQD